MDKRSDQEYGLDNFSRGRSLRSHILPRALKSLIKFLQLTHTYACGRADDLKAPSTGDSYGWDNVLEICNPRNAGTFLPIFDEQCCCSVLITHFYRLPPSFF